MHRIIFLLFSSLLALGGETALDRYVKTPDPAYQWRMENEVPCSGCKAHLLHLTSQTWMSKAEVDRPEWTHWLTVIRPEKITSNVAMLFINGGNNQGRKPDRADPRFAELAKASGAIVADLRMVPNQSLLLSGIGKPASEDEIIAFTWEQYLRTGDEKWPARLPMTKSAVRAMDAVTAFLKTPEQGSLDVQRYAVSGASKRGWTAWTTAAVDKRVVAAAPLVIDLLNIVPSMNHHWRAYGFWAPAIKDYEARNIFGWRDTREYKALMKIEEPFEYRDRLTMPKFLVHAAGDQFFLPDSSQFYFDKLKGETLMRYVPNTDHSMRDSDVVETLAAWFDLIAAGQPRPRFTWKIHRRGEIIVKTTDQPQEVKLWTAINPEKRDFRLESIGKAYKATVLSPGPDGRTWVAKLTKPERGYSASFVELTYKGRGRYPLKFTSGVKVMPDVYPFAPFQPKRPAK
jgi:PhoPQ-activated pathogenicity-related protein